MFIANQSKLVVRGLAVLAATTVSPWAFAQEPVPAAPATPPASPADAKPAQPPAPKWYDNLKVGAFADAYYSINYNFPHPETGTNASVTGPGGNVGRAYDFNNGFSLHWVGLDTIYSYGNVGGTVSLRFGPSTVGYNINDSPIGSQFIKQAYGTWKPLGAEGKLTLDFGKYDQPFGSEVADSQLNINYTRSFLYWLAQPLHFTGLRVDYAINDKVDVKLFLANGWNRAGDNNSMKTFGAQVMVKPVDQATFSVGYMGGAEQADTIVGTPPAGGGAAPVTRVDGANSRFRHFFDFVADINPTSNLRFLANADYATEDLGNNVTATWYGANLAINYKITDTFFVSPRGEWYVDDANPNGLAGAKTTLYDGTITLGYAPSPNLILKLDNRADFADNPIFFSKSLGGVKNQFTTTLGVVATTN